MSGEGGQESVMRSTAPERNPLKQTQLGFSCSKTPSEVSLRFGKGAIHAGGMASPRMKMRVELPTLSWFYRADIDRILFSKRKGSQDEKKGRKEGKKLKKSCRVSVGYKQVRWKRVIRRLPLARWKAFKELQRAAPTGNLKLTTWGNSKIISLHFVENKICLKRLVREMGLWWKMKVLVTTNFATF